MPMPELSSLRRRKSSRSGRANLWHGLRLPRRHGAQGEDIAIDLPYSNFAYDQTGTPWPVNQAVYVDYMLYDCADTTASLRKKSSLNSVRIRSRMAA